MYLVYLDNDYKRSHTFFDESKVSPAEAFAMALSSGVQPLGWCTDHAYKAKGGDNEQDRKDI